MILTPLGLLFFAVLIFSYVLEPTNGVLTRIGGYSENDFGWTQPQERFQSKLYETKRYGIYDKYYDAVVVGDSFSQHLPDEAMHPAAYWPNFFVHATGLDLISFNSNFTEIVKFIESDSYKKFPPRLLIFEVVERDFINVISWITGDCIPRKDIEIKPITIKPTNDKLLKFERNSKTGLSNFELDIGLNYLKQNFLGRINNLLSSSKVVLLNLDHEGLFSNALSKKTLFWGGDFKKFSFNEKEIQRAVCGLINLQNKVQSNNKTFFIAMIAPDKLSVYSNYILSLNKKENSIIDRIDKKPLHLPRIDVALKDEIKKGLVDAYLPNDTHWSSRGHKIAAQELVRYLKEHGIFIND